MKIIRLDVRETESGWHLKDARFDDLNLLVGVSGVGKTKIVEAIRTLVQLLLRPRLDVSPMLWTIECEHDGHRFSWEGEITRPAVPFEIFETGICHFMREKLTIDNNVIIRRDIDQLEFKGTAYPKLRTTASAISLLSGEFEARLVLAAFTFLTFESGNAAPGDGFRFSNNQHKETTFQRFESVFKELAAASNNVGMPGYGHVHQVMKVTTSIFPENKAESYSAYVLKMFFPERFARITDLFREIFPSVANVTVDCMDQLRHGGDPLVVQFAIKEHGSDQWILQPQMSSGMLRTLLHLLTVDTALPGSVIIIDEFENSLGKNCLPLVTETVQEHLGEIQFILTSHHPYVIHQIPINYWKLVHRRGNTVTLISARDIPALMDKSHHDAFDRLLNIKEFTHGIELADEGASA